MKKNNIDVLLFFLLFLVLFLFRLDYGFANSLSWDVFGYYLYLPSTFIYGDLFILDKTWLDSLFEIYKPSSTFYQAALTEEGIYTFQYTMGAAVLLSPFFFLAHLIAQLSNFPADGLSMPYQVSVVIGSLFYAYVGLIYLFKSLRHFFGRITTWMTLILVIFGTNYFQMIAFNGTLLTHNFTFSLYALLVYSTIKWNKNPSALLAISIGLFSGLITLIRPTEAICILIPVFWPILSNGNYFALKINLFKQYLTHILLAIVFFFLCFTPQLIYWKASAGSFFHYSYTNAGEGLDFLSPHTWDFLFSFRKGWIIYSPLVILALIGLIPLNKGWNKLAWIILLSVSLDVYVVSSWTSWWYSGASYSSRAILPMYVLLAFPLASLLSSIKQNGYLVKSAILISIAITLVLNLFQTWQYLNGIISKERMTFEYYQAIFGATNFDPSLDHMLLVNRNIPIDHIPNLKGYQVKQRFVVEGKNKSDSLSQDHAMLTSDNPFSRSVKVPFSQLTNNDHAWVRIKTILVALSAVKDAFVVAHMTHNGEPYKYQSIRLKSELNQDGYFTQTSFYLTPAARSKKDTLNIYIWNSGKDTVLFSSMIVDVFSKE